MAKTMICAPVPDRFIPCTLLYQAFWERYGAAERVLARNGWLYRIEDDGWVFGWGRQLLEAAPLIYGSGESRTTAIEIRASSNG